MSAVANIPGTLFFPEFTMPNSYDAQLMQETEHALREFQPNYDSRLPPEAYLPNSGQTLEDTQGGKRNLIMAITRDYVEKGDAWEFRVCPREVANSFVLEWITESSDPTLLDHTPENIAPRVVELKKSKHAVRLGHWQQGCYFNHENFLSAEGKQEAKRKLALIAQNVVFTQRYMIQYAIIMSANYFRALRSVYADQKHMSLLSGTADEVRRFICMNKDDKALHKQRIEIETMAEMARYSPDFDIAVVSEHLIPYHIYGHQYETEAFRRGDAAANANITRTPSISGIYPYPVYVNRRDFPTNRTGIINTMERETTFGQMSLLEGSDPGPTNAYGKPEPTIKIKSVRHDNWTKFSLTDALKNCPRFGTSGTITEYTNALIAKPNPFFKVPLHEQDPWLVETQGGKKARPVEMFAEQALLFRSLAFDIDHARRAAETLNLTQRDRTVLLQLLAAANECYEFSQGSLAEFVSKHLSTLSVAGRGTADTRKGEYEAAQIDVEVTKAAYIAAPTGAGTKDAFEKALRDVKTAKDRWDAAEAAGTPFFDKEGTWGGPLLQSKEPRGVGKPVGCGTVEKVLGILSQVTNVEAVFPEWHNAKGLSYGEAVNVYRRYYSALTEAYPSLITNTHEHCPHHLRTGDKDKDRMISVVSGHLERVKYPVWHYLAANARGVAVDVGIGTLGVTGGTHAATIIERLAETGQSELVAQFANGNVPADAFDIRREFADKVPEQPTLWQLLRYFATLTGVNYGNGRVDPTQDGAKAVGLTEAVDGTDANKAAESRYKIYAGFAAVLDGTAKLMRQMSARSSDPSWKAPKMSLADFVAMFKFGHRTADATRAGVAIGEVDAQWVQTPLVASPTSINPTGNYSLGDAENPYRPLEGRAGQLERARPFARAPYPNPMRAAQDEENEAYKDKDRVDGPVHYARDRDQFVGPRARVVGGPVLALEHLGFDDDGRPTESVVVERRHSRVRFANMVKTFAHDPFARACGMAFLMSRVEKKAFEAMAQAGLRVPMNFIIAHPFVKVRTEAMIFARSGKQTGRLGYNFGDILMGNTATHKRWIVNLTVWMAAVITDPLGVLIVPDVKAAGYLGGKDMDFFTSRNDFAKKLTKKGSTKCTFVFDTAPEFTREILLNYKNPAPLFGKHDRRVYSEISFGTAEVFDPTEPPFPGYCAANAFFEFDKMNTGKNYDATNFRMLQISKFISGTMYFEDTQTWNSAVHEWQQTINGTGHIDGLPVPGLKSLLDGKIPYNSALTTSTN